MNIAPNWRFRALTEKKMSGPKSMSMVWELGNRILALELPRSSLWAPPVPRNSTVTVIKPPVQGKTFIFSLS
jgi:hypothetical protein